MLPQRSSRSFWVNAGLIAVFVTVAVSAAVTAKPQLATSAAVAACLLLLGMLVA